MQKKDLSLMHEVLAPQEVKENPPLLVMLHGYGSHEQDLFSLAPALNKKFLIISARAPLTLPWGGFAWYEINFEETGGKFSNIEQARQSIKKLESFIEEAQNAYQTDKKQTWLMGFSQGCILSYALALNYPERFRGVLALSGYILREIVPEKFPVQGLRHLDFFISHGTMDQVLPVEWARQSIKILEQLKIAHQYREYPMPHGISPECLNDMKAWLKARHMI